MARPLIKRGAEGYWNQQTRRERSLVLEQMAMCSGIFPLVSAALSRYPKAQLMAPLKRISRERRLPEVPRICRRSRDALICYFCLYCPDVALFSPFLAAPAQAPRFTRPAASQVLAPFTGGPLADFPVDPDPGPVNIILSEELPGLWDSSPTEADLRFQMACE
jgi:hypothetical protein